MSACVWQPAYLKGYDRVGVLGELLCVRYGYCSQALLSSDEINFIVHFLMFAVMYTLLYFLLHYCVLLYNFHIKYINKLMWLSPALSYIISQVVSRLFPSYVARRDTTVDDR